jgi:hypothetical protein
VREKIDSYKLADTWKCNLIEDVTKEREKIREPLRFRPSVKDAFRSLKSHLDTSPIAKN